MATPKKSAGKNAGGTKKTYERGGTMAPKPKNLTAGQKKATLRPDFSGNYSKGGVPNLRTGWGGSGGTSSRRRPPKK